MKFVHLAGASLNQTPLAFEQNTRNIIAAIQEGKRRGIKILSLPELAISGYGCEDAFFSEYVLNESLKALSKIIAETKDILITVGLPMEYESCLYNVVAVVCDCNLLGFVAKQELAGDGIYYEPRWFKPWQEEKIVQVSWNGENYWFGRHLYAGQRFCRNF